MPKNAEFVKFKNYEKNKWINKVTIYNLLRFWKHFIAKNNGKQNPEESSALHGLNPNFKKTTNIKNLLLEVTYIS